MARVIRAGDLTDLYTYQHGPYNDPTTYLRGFYRNDACFASVRILDHLLRAGYFPYHDVFVSDHRGGFIDLSIESLFDRQIQSIQNPVGRILNATDPRQVVIYIEHLYDELVDIEDKTTP